MADIEHRDIPLGERHGIVNWKYADAAARAAATGFVATDIDKVASQSSDDSLWRLKSIGPNVWVQIGGSAPVDDPGVVYGTPTWRAGWVDMHGVDANWAPIRLSRRGKLVTMSGTIGNGNSSSASFFGDLPEGFRPDGYVGPFVVGTVQGGTVNISANPDGSLFTFHTLPASGVSVNISFMVP
jgi:hypothetical protein